MTADRCRSFCGKPWTMVTAAALAACAIQLALVAPARADGQPLSIESFAMEATERTEVVDLGAGVFEVTNKPYVVPFTQAGAHPWGLTIKGKFDGEELFPPEGEPVPVPTRDPKDIVIDLPPGLLGDPMATPRCQLTQVTTSAEQCPADTQIGFYSIKLDGGHQLLAPIVNVTPERGQSAEFALENTTKFDTPLITGRLVRTAAGYGFETVSSGIPLLSIESFEVTVWGVPADPSHDLMRGLLCRKATIFGKLKCENGGQAAGVEPFPFVTLPTDCQAGPETATLRADSWQEPGSVREGRYEGYTEAHYAMPGVTGCDRLSFHPTIEARPDTFAADEPVGLNVGLNVPLTETPDSTATPQVRDTTVSLPQGLSMSPGVVDGIEACDEFGPRGINITGPESEEIGPNGELQLAPGRCPDASIVGTAEAVTPFLPIPIKGHLYLARPSCGAAGQEPCTEQDALDGRLYRLYLELGGTGELAQTGVHFKVPLEARVNLTTGQITTTTLETPQAPFSELKVHLNGGPRAPLANPFSCAQAVTNADLTPWSAPGTTPQGLLSAGTPDAVSSSYFEVQGCRSTLSLRPGFVAGATSSKAGQFTAFTLDLTRADGEDYVKGLSVGTPPGLLGVLANVPVCQEPRADSGNCLETSRIGSIRVASGAGSHPFEIKGSVYLTEGYEGAPYGLSVVTHVVAGPFNLGLVVVRARILVDRHSSSLTVVTDATGPHAIPQTVFGVPLRLKRLMVRIDRTRFMFNPTSCALHSVTATILGTQGSVADVSSPFAVGSCRNLAFAPRFTATTSGRTSRRAGASLDTKLSYPKNGLGGYANIAKVKVDLPRRLPSRLTTLQKACTAATFAADPADCPQGSVVGVARATTPLLTGELRGPVYFVSHGGEAFPSLVIVLEQNKLRVDLVGTTFISKSNITSTTFKTIPDVPVGTFELYLPQGPGSALAANGDLCKQAQAGSRAGGKVVGSRKKVAGPLTMATEFTAQNGAVVRLNTRIKVRGCLGATGAVQANGKTRRGAK